MKKTVKTAFYIIGGIVFLLIDIRLLTALYANMREYFVFALLVCGLIIAMPLVIKSGIKALHEECDTVNAYLNRNLPVKYNTGRILSGFFRVLCVFWLIIPVLFLIPGKVFVFILPTVTVAIWVFEMKMGVIWSDIGWKKRNYWAMNIGAYLSGILIGTAVSALMYS